MKRRLRMSGFGVIGVVGVTLAAGVPVASAAPSMAASGGASVAGPDLGVVGPVMLGVQAVSPTDVWGVGTQPLATDGYGSRRQAFVAHFDGSHWTRIPAVSPSKRFAALLAVDADSSKDAWAGGEYENSSGVEEPLMERWDGTAWSQVAVPDAGPDGGELLSVVAISPDDAYAAGETRTGPQSFRGILDHWDGSSWTAVSAPDVADASASAVAATSASDVWLEGAIPGSPLIDHFDGTEWTTTKVADPGTGSLVGLAAVAPGDAWAVGYQETPDSPSLVEHFDGTRWRRVASPKPHGGGTASTALGFISAVSSTDVWAAGQLIYSATPQIEDTLVEHWDGTRWSIVPSPDPRPTNHVFGLSADSGTDAWLIGAKTGEGGMFVEHWNGHRWTVSRPF
jgi:hypothetical protein